MTESTNRINHTPVVVIGLAMALGPLAALSLGTRYADEETWARANAGLENATPEATVDGYGVSGEDAMVPAYASDKSLSDVLAGSGVFDTFEKAVKSVGLEERFAAPGDYTLFVPSDEAFARMPVAERRSLLSDQDALAAFIDKHVVMGRYTVADLVQQRKARTIDGNSIDVGPSTRYNGQIGVGGAEVIKTNLFASNGIVHVVDRVIQ